MSRTKLRHHFACKMSVKKYGQGLRPQSASVDGPYSNRKTIEGSRSMGLERIGFGVTAPPGHTMCTVMGPKGAVTLWSTLLTQAPDCYGWR